MWLRPNPKDQDRWVNDLITSILYATKEIYRKKIDIYYVRSYTL